MLESDRLATAAQEQSEVSKDFSRNTCAGDGSKSKGKKATTDELVSSYKTT